MPYILHVVNILNISLLLLTGAETSSGELGRILHLLALNQKTQSRLREELMAARENCGGQIPYDELMQLPYLDAVIRETLRV